jgi:glycosyltransferase involved in cell wall biosynthesis
MEAADYEIIVADDCSTDGSCDFLPAARKVNLRKFRADYRLGCSGARTQATKWAIGDCIIITDPHCSFPRGALPALAEWAMEKTAIVMPPVLLEGKSVIRGSGIRATTHGLVLRRMRNQPELPVLCGSIYAMSRRVWNELGQLPPLPGWWGSWEIFYSILAYRLGLDIQVAPVGTCTHRKYRPLKSLPYDLPEHHYALNAHWCHAIGLPVHYGRRFQKELNGSRRTRLQGDDWKTTAFYDVQQWVNDCSVRNEDWFMENVVGLKPVNVETPG